MYFNHVVILQNLLFQALSLGDIIDPFDMNPFMYCTQSKTHIMPLVI